MESHAHDLRRYAWLSIGAAVATIALKSTAFAITGSVGLLSDAMESIVNLVAAVVALVALTIAARPADEEHLYGHSKAEYISAAVEGAMILVAAGAILVSAAGRLLHPQLLEHVGPGLAVSVLAAVLNGAVARVLLRAGRKHRSITLAADGQHLMTDVWTSAGVVIGVGAVVVTGWERLDPLIAIAVGANIVVAGWRLISRSVGGLMDRALPAADHEAIDAVLDRYRAEEGVRFHALRSREAGSRRFVSVHVLVPGAWTVKAGHDLLERLEADLDAGLGGATVFTHMEPLEDPASFDRTAKARVLGDGARDIADQWFFETVVRIHRAGEGAPFTGLKPAGLDVGPVIPAAERALATGSVSACRSGRTASTAG